MAKFTCDGFRPVTADDIQTAANTFADRLARRVYGRRGYARTLRLDSWTQSGSSARYETFIGYSTGPGETSGRNEWLHVYLAQE